MSTLSGGQLSGGNTVDIRAENDFYATDPIAVEKLIQCLDKEYLMQGRYNRLEPCVGTGNICEAFKDKLCEWTCLDIVDRGYPDTVVADYLQWDSPKNYDLIVTNPPYSLATEFIKKSMTILAEDGLCCMYLKLQFLEGVKRKELFDKYPPKYIYVFRNRMATWKNGLQKNPDTGKKWAETICFAWFVWEQGFKGEPIIRWID